MKLNAKEIRINEYEYDNDMNVMINRIENENNTKVNDMNVNTEIRIN